MSEAIRLIAESADRLLGEFITKVILDESDAGTWPAALWQAVDEAGYAAAWDDQDSDSRDIALTLAHRTGWHAAPIPLAETLLARHVLLVGGITPPSGILTVANPLNLDSPTLDGSRMTALARRVPFARNASAGVVTVVDETVVLAPTNVTLKGSNMAGEPRDEVAWDNADVVVGGVCLPERLLAAGALLRSAQICGALQHALARATQYATEREQFGRPLGKFQAIQHYLARIACLSATAEAALSRASAAPDNANIAAAKICASEAAGDAATLAHQIHGAIGFTQEHALHHITKRLWSWREEFGAEGWWQEYLGGVVIGAGADGLWPLVVADS